MHISFIRLCTVTTLCRAHSTAHIKTSNKTLQQCKIWDLYVLYTGTLMSVQRSYPCSDLN